ncbi:MAG: LytTR family DNA-binding domain-containing protein [Cytophagales bacterium]|nr:LytTR family DNA-binding domain-containing protein [Cytophagales bacterium]
MIRCLIIEDEPLATDILKDYVNQIPFLQLRGTCIDAIEALEILRSENIDLLFLDIHLPGIKGLDFLRTLKHPPAVILTTAYHEYAMQGYELNVVDYLLKPIEFKRFLEAVNKLKKVSIPDQQKEVLNIHSDKKNVLIPIHEIVYLESQKEYIKIQTINSSHLTKYGLTKMEETLASDKFLRVHRSFIVALSKIKAFNGHEIELDGKTIPIGRNYREEVAQKLSKLY